MSRTREGLKTFLTKEEAEGRTILKIQEGHCCFVFHLSETEVLVIGNPSDYYDGFGLVQIAEDYEDIDTMDLRQLGLVIDERLY